MKRPLAAATITLAVLMTGVGVVLADANTGWLDVRSDPVAAIFIDDASTGLFTPQDAMPLVAGHHNLMLLSRDGGTSRIGFKVTAGNTYHLVMHPQ